MFKVGDRVRVKSDLQSGEVYNDCYFVSGMEIHRGKIAIITGVSDGNYQTCRYTLTIDYKHWYSNDMLDPIEAFDSPFYRVGDVVKIIDEIPEELYGIDKRTWSLILGKSGEILDISSKNSYFVNLPEIPASFWFSSKHLTRITPTSENSIKNVSKLIEHTPEIELSYCKKQIYTV